MTADVPALLACPFCGAPGMFFPHWPQEQGAGCTNCPAQMRGFDTTAAALAAWNHRVPQPVNAQLLAAAKAALKWMPGYSQPKRLAEEELREAIAEAERPR